MRRDRAERRAEELNAAEPGHFAFHMGRNRWVVRRRRDNMASEEVER